MQLSQALIAEISSEGQMNPVKVETDQKIWRLIEGYERHMLFRHVKQRISETLSSDRQAAKK